MGNYHSRLRPPFVVTNVLLVIPSKLFGLVGGANLTRNGTETDETEFMFELFQVYDKVNGTNLANQFRNEIEAAKKQGKLNWTQINQCMPSIKGKGYSATLDWVCNALPANDLNYPDVCRLNRLADKVVNWRTNEMKRHGGGDAGHQHAAKLWEAIRNFFMAIALSYETANEL